MCLGCWEDAGKPWFVSEEVKKWAPVFGQANHYGPCHIVVDDWNLEDDHIDFCLGLKPNDEEIALLKALKAMTINERWTTAVMGDYPDFQP